MGLQVLRLEISFPLKRDVSSVCQGDVDRVRVKLAPVNSIATNNKSFFRVVTFWPSAFIGLCMALPAK